MADASYLNIGDGLTAQHWNDLYLEANRRLNYHYNDYSKLFWADTRFLSHRRYFVFGTTPVKSIFDPTIANESEAVLANFAAGGFLVTSDSNMFFRDYDMTPFDNAVASAVLLNSTRSIDPRPPTSSFGPTALFSRSAFGDAFTGSCFPLRAGTPSGWALEEYQKSLFFSPKVHRKNVTFGPEFGGTVHSCSVVVDGAVKDTDVISYVGQPFQEYVQPFQSADWFIFQTGTGTWSFPSYETKEKCHMIHNISAAILAVNFAGTTWSIPPMGCLAVRRNSLTEFVKLAGGDGINSCYFWYFQLGDPIVLHRGVNGLDCGGNNVADPLMLNYLSYYLFVGWENPNNPPRYDKSKAWDISNIYANSSYVQQPYEVTMPVGGWYDLDESKPIGNLLVHKGPLLLASVNEIRENQSASFVVDANQDPHVLLRNDTGAPAFQVRNIAVYDSGSNFVAANAGTTWTASGDDNSRNIIYWTGSSFNAGDHSLVSFTAAQPSNRKVIQFRGFEHFVADLAAVSISVASAYPTNPDPNSFKITCPGKDFQLGTLGSNLLPILFNGSLFIDPHGNPPTFYGVYGPMLLGGQEIPVISAVSQSSDTFHWLNASSFSGGVWSIVSTSSALLHNYWRVKIDATGSSYYHSLFEPQSTLLNEIRNFGAPDQNADVESYNTLTVYGPTNVTTLTVPVDYPGLNFLFSQGDNDLRAMFDLDTNYQSGSGNFWTRRRGTAAAFSLGDDQFFGWSAPGTWRAGEITVPRDRQGYGITRTFTHNPATENFVISGNISPYPTDEDAGLYNFFEGNNGTFRDYSSNWTGTLVPAPAQYELRGDSGSIAFLYPYSPSPNKRACLSAWLNNSTSSYNGGFLDYGVGSARHTSYYPNNKFELLSNSNRDDDNLIKPVLLKINTEHFNIAASGLNHTFGTAQYGDWTPHDYFMLDQLFPANSKGRGITTLKRQFGAGTLSNIRPIDAAYMWVGGTTPPTISYWHDLSASAMLATFGITMKTAADIPDAKFQIAISDTPNLMKWGYVDLLGSGWHTSVYFYGDINNGSQSLWKDGTDGAPGYWQQLYPLNGTNNSTPIDRVRYITFADAISIASQLGFKFATAPEILVPLAFDYVPDAPMTNLQDDNSGVFNGGQYLFAVSSLGWYNDVTGSSQWVADYDDPQWIRNDTSPIKDCVANCEPSPTPGVANALIKLDHRRLPELWHSGIGGMPTNGLNAFLSQNAFCDTTLYLADDNTYQKGHAKYIYRHYGPSSGSYRGQALIWPRNSIRRGRGHVTSLHNFSEWINFFDYNTWGEWFSVPKAVVTPSITEPFAIPFMDNETVIEAPALEYGKVEIVAGFHNFSTDP